MVWPVGELQVFYKVTTSCLWREKGTEKKGGREEEGEERDLSTSYIKDLN